MAQGSFELGYFIPHQDGDLYGLSRSPLKQLAKMQGVGSDVRQIGKGISLKEISDITDETNFSGCVAGITYGDEVTHNLSACSAVSDMPCFCLSGRPYVIADDASHASTPLFSTLLPSPSFSGFLLGKATINIYEQLGKPQNFSVLFVCMDGTDDAKDVRWNSFAATVAHHSNSRVLPRLKVIKHEILTENSDDMVFGQLVDKVVEDAGRDVKVISCFGYGTRFCEFVEKIATHVSLANADVRVLCDFNYTPTDKSPRNIDVLCLKSFAHNNGDDSYVVGTKVFDVLVIEATKIIAGITDKYLKKDDCLQKYGDSAQSRALLWDHLCDLKYYRSSIGTILFRGSDRSICYPIYQKNLSADDIPRLVDAEEFIADNLSTEEIAEGINQADAALSRWWKTHDDMTLQHDLYGILSHLFAVSDLYVRGCSANEKPWECYSRHMRNLALEDLMALLPANRVETTVQFNLYSQDAADNGTLRVYCHKAAGGKPERGDRFDERYACFDAGKIFGTIPLAYADDVGVYAYYLAYSDTSVWTMNDSALTVGNWREMQQSLKAVACDGKYAYYICFGNDRGTRSVGVLYYARCKLRARELKFIENILSGVYSAYEEWMARREVDVANTKSAIGSIMSRNGSHNIGSHVLAALSHNVSTMPDDRILYQYIQHRMDYIATTTTDLPTWTYSTKFVGGMMKDFLSQRHLLEYISKSEGLSAFKFQDPNLSASKRIEQSNTLRIHIRRKGFGLMPDKGQSVEAVDFIDYPASGCSAIGLEDMKRRMQQDLDVALPGGVIGQHAFFTILENVIRNSAKHGWAIKKAKEKKIECQTRVEESEREGKNGNGAYVKANNLNVYIEFELEKDCRAVSVCVYDNISNALSPFEVSDRLEADELILKGVLKNWYGKNKTFLQQPLQKDDLAAVASFLSGDQHGEKVLKPVAAYAEQYQILTEHCKVCKEDLKKIQLLLSGRTTEEGSLGNRLWLPMHHRQQARLARSFINDDGSSRRENWGLAEMKISAGYLQMRTIGEIGGLDESVNDWQSAKAILTPIAYQQQQPNDDVSYRLGYQFRIRCPRELCFVIREGECDQGNRKVDLSREDVLSELRRNGVYVRVLPDDPTQYASMFAIGRNGSQEDNATTWDYHYVVLPEFPQVDDPDLPFRVLSREPFLSTGPRVIPSLGEEYDSIKKCILGLFTDADVSASTVDEQSESIKCTIYKKWLEYWVITRREGLGGCMPRLVLDVFNEEASSKKSESKDKTTAGLPSDASLDKNAERSIFTDSDIWGIVFKELFRTLVREHLKKDFRHELQLPFKCFLLALCVGDTSSVRRISSSCARGDIGRLLLDWYCHNYRSDATSDATCEVQRCEPLFDLSFHQMVKDFLHEAQVKYDVWFDVDFKKPDVIMGVETFVSALEKWIKEGGFYQDSPKVNVNGALYNYPGFREFMTSCERAFDATNVLFRKYEERIVTLPENFKPMRRAINVDGDARATLRENAFRRLGLIMELPGSNSLSAGRDVHYIRHFESSNFDSARMLYAEPLSGTQSYLNTLGRLVLGTVQNPCGVVTELMENALARVLIIDERVANFLREHPEISPTYAQMGVWVLDDKTVDLDREVDEKTSEDKPLLKKTAALLPAAALLFGEALRGLGLLPELVDDRMDQTWWMDRVKNFDILIIHQGLLDKWMPGLAHTSGGMEKVIKALRSVIPYVVITTGRGTPANTPEIARILPFSVLEKTLYNKSPEKLVLVETVMSVLPKGIKR